MDPITLAIVTAISVGVVAGSEKVAEKVVVDAYEGLKNIIQRKFGGDSEIIKTIEGLEARPNSEARRITLKEEIELTKSNDDPEIAAKAQELLEKIKQQPNGIQQVQQVATGNFIAQASHGGYATVNVNKPIDE